MYEKLYKPRFELIASKILNGGKDSLTYNEKASFNEFLEKDSNNN